MKINKVNLSKVTTYRFGGICENFITLEDPNEILNLVKTHLDKFTPDGVKIECEFGHSGKSVSYTHLTLPTKA